MTFKSLNDPQVSASEENGLPESFVDAPQFRFHFYQKYDGLLISFVISVTLVRLANFALVLDVS